MRYQRFGDRLQVRLESGDRVIESLTRLAAKEGIGYAALNGLGAVRRASLAYYDVEAHEYETHEIEEQLEVTSLIGNVSLKESRAFLHVHVNLGRRDLSVIGGHLMEATAHSTLEVWLNTEPGSVRRLPDEETGLALLELSEAG